MRQLVSHLHDSLELVSPHAFRGEELVQPHNRAAVLFPLAVLGFLVRLVIQEIVEGIRIVDVAHGHSFLVSMARLLPNRGQHGVRRFASTGGGFGRQLREHVHGVSDLLRMLFHVRDSVPVHLHHLCSNIRICNLL